MWGGEDPGQFNKIYPIPLPLPLRSPSLSLPTPPTLSAFFMSLKSLFTSGNGRGTHAEGPERLLCMGANICVPTDTS